MDFHTDRCPCCAAKCKFLDNSCYNPDCVFEGMDKRIAKKIIFAWNKFYSNMIYFICNP